MASYMYDTPVGTASDNRLRVLALSCAISHAGDWLNVVTSPVLGLHPLNFVHTSSTLSLTMFEEGVNCPVCWATADPFGDHHRGCGDNGDYFHQCGSMVPFSLQLNIFFSAKLGRRFHPSSKVLKVAQLNCLPACEGSILLLFML